MTSLAHYATEVELICQEIDAVDGPIPPELVARFAAAQGELVGKVDRFIGFLDALKSRVALLKEHRDRATKAIRAAEGFERGLKEYVRTTMQAMPGIPYKGETGAFRLQRNPPSLKIDFPRDDKTIYQAVDPVMLTLEPTLADYVKTVTAYVIDTEKLKAALDAGEKIPWARIEQGVHLRVQL